MIPIRQIIQKKTIEVWLQYFSKFLNNSGSIALSMYICLYNKACTLYSFNNDGPVQPLMVLLGILVGKPSNREALNICLVRDELYNRSCVFVCVCVLC